MSEKTVKIDIAKTLKMLMLDKNIKQVEAAEKFGMGKTTFNNLIQRNNFKLNDIIEIAEILDCDIKLQFIDKKSGKITEVETEKNI